MTKFLLAALAITSYVLSPSITARGGASRLSFYGLTANVPTGNTLPVLVCFMTTSLLPAFAICSEGIAAVITFSRTAVLTD